MVIGLFCISGCQIQTNKDYQNNQVVYLNLWQGINPPKNRDVFNKLVDKFNQSHPDIQVKSIFSGANNPLAKILTAVVGNSAPDMLIFYPQLTGQFVQLEAIKPLDDWFNQLPIRSDVISTLLPELKLDGHLWSIPYSTANLGIFYRPDLFQAAGVTETPKTWDELRAVAKKLTIDKNGDKRPEQYGILLPLGKQEWTVFCWFPFLLGAGGDILDDNYPNLTNSGAITALKFWENLIKDGTATLSPPERGYEEDAFISGRIAMQITGPWTYITTSPVKYDVFPIPANINRATTTGTGNLFLMKTTPEKEKAALKFFEFVLSEQFQTEWAIGTGFLPVNIKSAQSQEYQEYVKSKPWLKVFLDQISVAGSRPILAGYSRISDNLGRAIEETLLGKSSAEVALQAAQKRLELIWPDRNF
ncbi:ABC transporter substrate-binding protein [Anabaena sp. FACHB-1237]|uniref:ABC transporter substrate-binding protein n=1 Tax=Anabaena sp. FACHB-1237 TaxID=2692769 RepID=UPI001F558707|nr:ABC transporter substrate-binding protein [Anabaena sp. FACHB-1237]